MNSSTELNQAIVAITGATGFIGGTLARRLQADGWRVRVLVRDPARADDLAKGGAELVRGSLADRDALRRLVADAQAVVHCAGAVRGASQAEFDRTNVAGVTRIAQTAAEQTPAPRFLSLSSLAAREPALSFYAASKRKGEQALQDAAAQMDWAALRPPAVYGPGDKELLPLFRLMGRGVAPIIAPADARFSIIFVDDLAAAVSRWLTSDPCPRGVFELHDGHRGGYSWDDVIGTVEGLTGRRLRRLRISPKLLRLPAAFNLLAGRVLPYAPMLTPGKLRELTHADWVCENDRIRAVLDWAPRVTLEEGLRRTPGWRPMES